MRTLEQIIIRGDLFAVNQQIELGIEKGAIKASKADYWRGVQVTLITAMNELERAETELSALRNQLASERIALNQLTLKLRDSERLQEELREENRNFREGIGSRVFEASIGLAGRVADGDEDVPF